MVPFKCDVHGWMNAYVGVLDHPYYAVTGEGRQVRAEGSAGRARYTIEAWHEKLGTQDAEGHARRRRNRRTSPSPSAVGGSDEQLTQAGRGRKGGWAGGIPPCSPSCPSRPYLPTCP